MSKVEEVARSMRLDSLRVGKKPPRNFASLPAAQRGRWMERARNAIRVMREPSQAMLDEVSPSHEMIEDWRAMIDAALVETP